MLMPTLKNLATHGPGDTALLSTHPRHAAAVARILREAGIECAITGPAEGHGLLVSVSADSLHLALTILAKRRKDVEEEGELDDEEEEDEAEDDDDDIDDDEDDDFDDEEEDEEDFEEEFADDELDDDDDDIFYDEDEDE